jgi:hypothetical protein
MKGVFWNSRGLADLAKHRFLAELVKQGRLILLLSLKLVASPFPIMSSKIFVLDVIFFGMLWLPMVDQVASC